MIRRPPRSTRTDTLFPYTTLFRSVLYSHRSNYIHALMTLQRDALALSARDTVLLVVPMYHAHAWGVVYSAPAVGAKLVLPGQRMDGESIYDLISSEERRVGKECVRTCRSRWSPDQ